MWVDQELLKLLKRHGMEDTGVDEVKVDESEEKTGAVTNCNVPIISGPLASAATSWKVTKPHHTKICLPNS